MTSFKNTLILFGLFLSIVTLAQDLPVGYIKHYENSFSLKTVGDEIIHSSALAVQVKSDGKNGWLELNNTISDSTLFPSGMLLFADQLYGDFILKAKIKYSINVSDSLSGLYLIGSLRDSSNYYSICIKEGDSKFYRVYNGVQTLLATEGNLSLLSGKWYNLRITRNIQNRTFTMQSGNQRLIIKDASLVMGFVGFGVNQSVVSLDDLVIWAPTSIQKNATMFRNTVK